MNPEPMDKLDAATISVGVVNGPADDPPSVERIVGRRGGGRGGQA